LALFDVKVYPGPFNVLSLLVKVKPYGKTCVPRGAMGALLLGERKTRKPFFKKAGVSSGDHQGTRQATVRKREEPLAFAEKGLVRSRRPGHSFHPCRKVKILRMPNGRGKEGGSIWGKREEEGISNKENN